MKMQNYKKECNLTSCLLILFIITFIIVTGCSKKESKVLGTITVDAEDYDRINTPIRFPCLPADIFGDPAKFHREGFPHFIGDEADISLFRDHHLVLVEEGVAESRMDVQWDARTNFDFYEFDINGALMWIFEGKIPKGTRRTFKLILEERAAPPRRFTVDDIDNKYLLLKKDNKPVLQYNYGVIHNEESSPGLYDRASYIHPVWTPSGEIITEDFSPEQTYLKGIFNGWKRVKFNDLEVNFWDIGSEQGQKVQEPLGPSVTTGPVFSRLDFYNQSMYKGSTFMREVCNIRTYALPEEDIWLFDIYIRQKPVDPKDPRKMPTYFAYSGTQRLFNSPADAKDRRKTLTEITTATVKEKEAIFTMELLQSPFGGMTFRGTDAWR